MKKEKTDIVQKTKTWLLAILVFLFPITFSNIFNEAHSVTRLLILSIFSVLLLLTCVIRPLVTKKFVLKSGPLTLPLGILTIVYTLSGFLRTPNVMEAFFFPGTAAFMIMAFLLYQHIIFVNKKEKAKIRLSLLISSALASVVVLLSVAGFWKLIPQLAILHNNPNFTLLGGILPSAIFFAVTLPISFELFMNKKAVAEKVLYIVTSFVIAMALAVSVYSLLPGKDTSLKIPSFSTTWSVAIDSIKEGPLLGIGPGNYLSAFNRFLPVSYNLTDLWNVRFPIGGSFYLTTMTEAGLLGFAMILLLIYISAKTSTKGSVSGAKMSVLLSLLIMALLPVSNFMFVIFVTILGLSQSSKIAYSSKIPDLFSRALFAIMTPVILAAAYFYGRFFVAEYHFKMSLKYLSQINATSTYQTMIKAINLSPKTDRYRIAFAQVNYALAETKVASIEGQSEISQEDRSAIAALLKTSIDQAKAATALNPSRSGNWEMLARIYKSIIAFAQGAEGFAVQSFSQAIALDPINPNLRIELGGIYYTLGAFEEAQRSFELAVIAKPDHANSHYNLAAAYRENNQLEAAIDQMNIVLSLTEKDSNDYQVALTELQNLENKRPQTPEEELPEPNDLVPPQEPQEPVIDPKIEVPTTDELPETEEVEVPTE